MRRLLVGLIALAGLTAFAPAPPPRPGRAPGKLDLERLEGRWVLLRLEDGQEGGPPKARAFKLEAAIADGAYTFFRVSGNGPPQRGKTSPIALDSSKSPCWFDLLNPDRTPSTMGVCALDGDTLRICYVLRGKDRPRSVTPSRGGETLMVFQRKKP